MSSRYEVGQVAVSTVRFYNANELTDPSVVTFKIRQPNGETSTYVYGTDAEVEKLDVGVYKMEIDCEIPGDYFYRIEATGTVKDAYENSFSVKTPRVA